MDTWIKIVNNDKEKKEIDLKPLRKVKTTWFVEEKEESHVTLFYFTLFYYILFYYFIFFYFILLFCFILF